MLLFWCLLSFLAGAAVRAVMGARREDRCIEVAILLYLRDHYGAHGVDLGNLLELRGTIYVYLHRLEARNLVMSWEETPFVTDAGAVIVGRRHYALTDKGNAALPPPHTK